MPTAYCRVLLCNINKKSSCYNGGFLVISNKYLVTFHFSLAIYHIDRLFHRLICLFFYVYFPIYSLISSY